MKSKRSQLGAVRSATIAAVVFLATLPCLSQPGTPPSRPTPNLRMSEAVALALRTASTYQAFIVGQNLATEDLRQARAAFLPRVTAPTIVTYNSAERGRPLNTGVPLGQSFISLNAIREYQSAVSLSGELDISGRLSATLRRNRDLLAAARAGTEVARRDLVIATEEAYYGVALTAAKLDTADRNVATAREFERVTGLMANGGEVPSIDLSRARLQTTIRLDEQQQARAGLAVATESLRFLIGYDTNSRLGVESLESFVPVAGEIDSISSQVSTGSRPEITLIEAQREAALEDARIARAERRPSVIYNLNVGADTDSLQPSLLNRHAGASAFVGLSVPIFDWGISRSRERQAQSRGQVLGLQRQLFDRSVIQQLVSARALAAAQRSVCASPAAVLSTPNGMWPRPSHDTAQARLRFWK